MSGYGTTLSAALSEDARRYLCVVSGASAEEGLRRWLAYVDRVQGGRRLTDWEMTRRVEARAARWAAIGRPVQGGAK